MYRNWWSARKKKLLQTHGVVAVRHGETETRGVTAGDAPSPRHRLPCAVGAGACDFWSYARCGGMSVGAWRQRGHATRALAERRPQARSTRASRLGQGNKRARLRIWWAGPRYGVSHIGSSVAMYKHLPPSNSRWIKRTKFGEIKPILSSGLQTH